LTGHKQNLVYKKGKKVKKKAHAKSNKNFFYNIEKNGF